MIQTTLMSSCRWKMFVPFLAKEKTLKCTFSINRELSQNRKEKQIIPFKTTVDWQFNNMCYYLAVAFFDWKIGVFQQTVVSVVLMIVFLIKPDFFKGNWVLFHRFELSLEV